MLNVGRIEEGFVLDHIKAGKAMTIYRDLGLDKLDCTVAIIKNARSNKLGKKDIIKVECPIDDLDLDIVGFIDHNITVNIIKDGIITEKRELSLPKQIVNVIRCKNPLWITCSSLPTRSMRFTAVNTVKRSIPATATNKSKERLPAQP